MQPLDRILFETSSVRVGAFRCPVGHQRFRDSGPIERHLVCFPRTGVWIRQAGSRWMVADQRVVTVYNRGQRYDRAVLCADGDRSDWFAVSPAVALAMVRELDPGAPDEPERAFRFEWAPSDPSLYLRQRRLFLRLERGACDPLAAEEEVLRLVGAVLARAAGAAPPWPSTRRAAQARRDLVERARAELARAPEAPTDVTSLAAALDTSPFHLCRVFRAATGTTLHAYRVDLRLRAAVEHLSSPRTDLSRLALDLGFSSHSHFTAVLRRTHGWTPSACRAALSA